MSDGFGLAFESELILDENKRNDLVDDFPNHSTEEWKGF